MIIKRRRFVGVLLLACVAGACSILFYLSSHESPEAKSRKAFRQNLINISPNWSSIELDYSPSDGCGYTASAFWKKGEEVYAFGGLRYPDSPGMSGTAVSVYSVKDNRIDKTLVWYRFTSDRQISKIVASEGIGTEMDWAQSIAHDFVNAMPDYNEKLPR